jgi:hypothetical protein
MSTGKKIAKKGARVSLWVIALTVGCSGESADTGRSDPDSTCQVQTRDASISSDSICGADRAVSKGVCRVQMHDALNEITSTLQAMEIKPSHFIVTDRLTSVAPWSVEAWLTADGKLETTIGVPKVTREELMTKYAMKDDHQLTFTRYEDYPCSPLETSLIYFLIQEWFYFG